MGVLIANIFICSCCASPQIIASADWNWSGLFVNFVGPTEDTVLVLVLYSCTSTVLYWWVTGILSDSKGNHRICEQPLGSVGILPCWKRDDENSQNKHPTRKLSAKWGKVKGWINLWPAIQLWFGWLVGNGANECRRIISGSIDHHPLWVESSLEKNPPANWRMANPVLAIPRSLGAKRSMQLVRSLIINLDNIIQGEKSFPPL